MLYSKSKSAFAVLYRLYNHCGAEKTGFNVPSFRNPFVIKGCIMKLLSDTELHDKIENGELVSTGFNESDESCWTAKESAIQPCSLDLHIGEIFIPKEDDGALSEHSLKPGETVVIKTREVLKLSSKTAAIGFPPSSMSRKGILTTNPGHVDPGYEGVFHITLINMGKKPYPLTGETIIATLLFFELDDNVEKGYEEREGQQNSSDDPPSELGYLAPDFMDFESRTKLIAEEAVSKAETKLKYKKLWASIVVPVLVVFISGVFAWINSVESGKIEVLEKINAAERLKKIEGNIDEYKYAERLVNLEKQVKSLTDKNRPLNRKKSGSP